jgi:hypothetical protein
MSAPIRKKPLTRRSAAKIASSNPNDLKARFQAVTDEIAADLRAVTDEITNAVMMLLLRHQTPVTHFASPCSWWCRSKFSKTSRKDSAIGCRLLIPSHQGFMSPSIGSSAQNPEYRHELHQ